MASVDQSLLDKILHGRVTEILEYSICVQST